jgi:AraC-like DNA-binding protein
LTTEWGFLTSARVSLSRSNPSERPAFVSTQVTDAQRYYLDLKPRANQRITVVCGGRERMNSEYRVARETFPFLCVEFVAQGSGSLRLNGKEHRLRPGIAFAYAPGIPHVIRNDPAHPMLKYYVDFAGREAAQLLAATKLGNWMPAQIAAPQEILEIFDALQRDAFAEGTTGPDLCAAHLRLLLLKIAQRAVPPRSAEPRAMASYQRARCFMEEHFTTLRTAEDVARGCHMTPVHLSRVFRRFGRISPYQLLTRLKMNRAVELLLESGLLVKEAAEQLGYANQFQFSRAFKRVYGLAPDHFTKQGHRGSP